MYFFVHLYYLGGVGGRRLTVLTTWISASFGSRHGRIIEGALERVERPLSPTAPQPTEKTS